MSIINDALKKAQFSFKKKEKPIEKKPDLPSDQSVSNVYEKLYKTQGDLRKTASVSGDAKQKSSLAVKSPLPQRWLQTSVSIILFLALAYGGFYFLEQYPPAQKLIRSFKSKIFGSQARTAQTTPKKRKYKSGELVLNGTSLIDGKRVALINDEIYEVGDTVDGNKIISIEMNQIELSDNEVITTLKIH
ncbi:MAG TPA: hypothetical protein PKV41_01490 [Candidatus Omnitrophota bacterium]|nr:hypothetical protein [Candidatus Omnitrophota bacterium]